MGFSISRALSQSLGASGGFADHGWMLGAAAVNAAVPNSPGSTRRRTTPGSPHQRRHPIAARRARFCISSRGRSSERPTRRDELRRPSARTMLRLLGNAISRVHANNVAVRDATCTTLRSPEIHRVPGRRREAQFRDRVPSARASPARSQRQIRDETGAALSCGAGLGVEAAQDTAGERNVDALDRIVEQSRAEGRHAEHPAAKVRIFA